MCESSASFDSLDTVTAYNIVENKGQKAKLWSKTISVNFP